MAEVKKSSIKKHARSVILEQLNESSRTMDRIIGEFQENKRRMIDKFGDLDKYDDLSTLEDDITDAVNCISTMMFNINAINSELDMLYHRLSDDWMNASTKKSKIKKSIEVEWVVESLKDNYNIQDEEITPSIRDLIKDLINDYEEEGEDEDSIADMVYEDCFKSTKKSKMKKSISQDMEMYGGQINVSAGPGRGSQNWDFMDYCMELEESDDESALNDLCEKIDRGETSFCIHRNDGWDYDIMVIKSTKKSISESKDTKMSFENNVNKMRQCNYDRIGNINTVMRERK